MSQSRALVLCLAVFAASLILQEIWIMKMRRLKIGQIIKKYGPEAHMKKTGTPSMGGVTALLAAPFAIALAYRMGLAGFGGMVRIWVYPFLAASVGLLDDVFKFRSNSSEGLRSLQKLALQIVLTLPWAIAASMSGLYWLPGIRIGVLPGVLLLLFLGVGVQNAVNVTDGLDGLAGGASAISLTALLLCAGGEDSAISAAIGIAMLLAFLWHNANPASVFMGDVGAHFWAGLMISICVASDSLLLIFPIGFLFGIELVTSAVQIIAIRKFGRKVFKMSPLHHHFELCGWSEPKIVTRFWLAHIVGMAVLFLVVFLINGGGL